MSRLLSGQSIKILFGILIVFVLFLLSSIILQVYTAGLKREYLRLCGELFQLEKEEKSRNAFELMPIPSGIPKLGNTEKYFLRDEEFGRQWMFKLHPFSFYSMAAEGVSRFARTAGINTPEQLCVYLPINGRPYFGTLQEFVVSTKFPVRRSEFDLNDPRQRQSLEQAAVLAYLFDFRPDFIIPSNGVPLIVDLDDLHVLSRFWSELGKVCRDDHCQFAIKLFGEEIKQGPTPGESFHAFMMNYMKQDAAFEGFLLSTHKVIHLIADMDDKDILSFFDPRIRSSLIFKEYMASVLERKKHLLRTFNVGTRRYSAVEMLVKILDLKNRIGLIRQRLSNMQHQQRQLNVVGSPEAWLTLNAYKQFKAYVSWERIEEILSRIKDQSRNEYEKMGVDRHISASQQEACVLGEAVNRFRYEPAPSQDISPYDPQGGSR